MENVTRGRLTDRNIWIRALYMFFFLLAYSISEIVLSLVVLFQFLAILFTGRANEPVLRLGSSLSTYIYQILKFVTFNTEIRPFPFSEWPEDDLQENRWVQPESTTAQTSAPMEPSSATDDPATDQDLPTGSQPDSEEDKTDPSDKQV